MPEEFLHGVEVVEIDSGPRPIRTVKSSVIGLVGTAPEAKDDVFPYDTPVLLAGSLKKAKELGETGTLPAALQGIFDQIGAMVVVIRVNDKPPVAPETTDNENTALSAIIGKAGEPNTGIYALLDAKSTVHVEPRILIAPEFSHIKAAADTLIIAAERLGGVAIIDGPNTTGEEAVNYRKAFGKRYAYLVDPWVKVWNSDANEGKGGIVIEPPSARVAGLMAKIDNDNGFWHSPSNKLMNGVLGTARPIDFKLGDKNCRANYLNSHDVTTIIQEDGYRLWGNRTCSGDPKWAFINVVRTAEIIYDSLQRAHMWAVDRNISKNYVADVTEGVNNYLRRLKNIGAILGGTCWADPDLNTPDALADGKVYFNFDFTPPTPAEHITFNATLTDDYFKEVLSARQ
ncbi:phage tail sheath C-terminal domain-containing protein [Spartinivicinus marinus]|nr:phage tail sheath C-terminal domain-containing protein [Spartinivicinus marinus]MCX4025036.1 phage tail sheath subtilisin-like domain-containing protein [Spartinivicinus marinus]MCX4027837.1 phage tail sheath subtilisin-like domain-containing protein [Spartinivicinus marinus]